ncbi:MAG: 2-oxo-4-hydroxy-4-carboxy-5-ureidoimidazoline decarboxylase [Verrucomicrobiota bacterium]
MPESPPLSISSLNKLPGEEFVKILGGIFEKSPWVAEAASTGRPYPSRNALLAAMVAAVESAGAAPLLDLIRAHPDLGARLQERAALTPESLREQGDAGLFSIDDSELNRLRALNTSYSEKFGFPFIICARLSSLDTIFESIQRRLHNSRDAELAEAWHQIQKIAELRLADLVTDTP